MQFREVNLDKLANLLSDMSEDEEFNHSFI